MIEKIRSQIWFYFIAVVFWIMLATAFTFSIIGYIFIQLGYINILKDITERESIKYREPYIFFICILLISIIIGICISSFVVKKILRPITIISRMSHEVAKGNFTVRLEDDSHIVEIHELNRNFNIMVQELSGIETLRNDFIVNVSHEFKTPIAAIEGYAALLRDKELSESERDEYTQMIIDSSRQLSVLTGNILTLSKLEAQEIILEKKPYRLDEQIRQAILLLETQWSMKELNLQIDMPTTVFYGNEGLLMQVWLNIIGNAVKFTSHNGKIRIQLSSRESSEIISISDNGCGMDDVITKRVFDKFYQGDTTRKSEGNGLGLALAKRIVELCGGEIKVRSETGKGSTFTVILPNIV